MRWWKKMSVTDAQQPTKGRLVPYLRFIRGKNIHNNQVWFRQTFFGGQAWTNGFFGQHPVEQCSVPIDVSINGVHKGVRQFLVTHDGTRMNNNNAPNTWLHFDDVTLAELRAFNTHGMTFSVEKTPAGYTLDIS